MVINNTTELEQKVFSVLDLVMLDKANLYKEVSKKIEDNLNFPFPEDIVWPAFLYFWVGQDNVSYEDFKEWRKV